MPSNNQFPFSANAPGFPEDWLGWKLDYLKGMAQLPHIVAPTSTLIPNGSVWTTTTGLFARINGATVGPYAIAGVSITGWTQSLNVSSPNDTVNASRFLASGGTTNQDAVIQPKGTGAVLAQLPDGTAVGGNKRGGNAVDFQTSRSAATGVASGEFSFIGGGDSNLVNATASSIVGGSGNQCSHNYTFIGGGGSNEAQQSYTAILGGVSNIASANAAAILGGSTNTASGAHSSTLGGENNLANASHSTASGYYSSTKGIIGAFVHASGQFSNRGDAQRMSLILRAATADATPTVLTSDAQAAAATNQATLEDSSAYLVNVRVVAKSSADRAAYSTDVLIYRDSGAASTTVQGSPTVTTLFNSVGAAAWVVAVAADTTNGALKVTVTGAAATTIRWVCEVRTIESVG